MMVVHNSWKSAFCGVLTYKFCLDKSPVVKIVSLVLSFSVVWRRHFSVISLNPETPEIPGIVVNERSTLGFCP